MANLNEKKDTGHALDEMLAPSQGLHKLFGREWYRWHQTLKTCAQARVIGRSFLGGVRVTLDGMGRVSNMAIADSLSKELDSMASQVIDAFNDARQKMHDFKKFEWEKYLRRDLEKQMLKTAEKLNTGFDEFSDLKSQTPVDDFARVLDLDTEYNSVNSVMMPPYPYDDAILEEFTLLERYFAENKISMKECCEDFPNIHKYLESKGMTWDQFEQGWFKYCGKEPFHMRERDEDEQNAMFDLACGLEMEDTDDAKDSEEKETDGDDPREENSSQEEQ